MITSIRFSPLVSAATLQPSLSIQSCRFSRNLSETLRGLPTLKLRAKRRNPGIVAATSNDILGKPSSNAPSLYASDVIWPCAGAFAVMALLGKIDQILEPKGLQILIAPFGAVCTLLFVTPSAPPAQEYNMFLAQICCGVIAVVAWNIFGGGWLCKGFGLAASIAFMIITRSVHPPAASLPIVFVDIAKFHQLNFWYALFPGLAGCLIIWMIKQVVLYLKEKARF